MAKVEKIRLVDDITGDEADETVDFGLDGRLFEIDLSSAHARRLRDGLARFVSVARPADTGGTRQGRARTAAPAATTSGTGSDAATREHNRAVRVWARENGFTVSERGRIPSEVVEAYRRGTPAQQPDQPAAQQPAEQPAEQAAQQATQQPVPAAPEQENEQAPEPEPAADRKQAPSVQFSG